MRLVSSHGEMQSGLGISAKITRQPCHSCKGLFSVVSTLYSSILQNSDREIEREREREREEENHVSQLLLRDAPRSICLRNINLRIHLLENFC